MDDFHELHTQLLMTEGEGCCKSAFVNSKEPLDESLVLSGG